jgi:hypothetical protein
LLLLCFSQLFIQHIASKTHAFHLILIAHSFQFQLMTILSQLLDLHLIVLIVANLSFRVLYLYA